MNSGRTVAHYRAEVHRLESQLAAANERIAAMQKVVDAARKHHLWDADIAAALYQLDSLSQPTDTPEGK